MCKLGRKTASLFAAITNDVHFTNKRRSCSRNTRTWRQNPVWQFSEVKFCLFNLNLSIKGVKKFLLYQCKLTEVLRYFIYFIAEMFINN